jgi:hypothetical protein
LAVAISFSGCVVEAIAISKPLIEAIAVSSMDSNDNNKSQVENENETK